MAGQVCPVCHYTGFQRVVEVVRYSLFNLTADVLRFLFFKESKGCKLTNVIVLGLMPNRSDEMDFYSFCDQLYYMSNVKDKIRSYPCCDFPFHYP